MKLEKKLILCSILAIAIGIATIVPMEYLMTADAQTAVANADAQVAAAVNAQATIEAKPWNTVNVPYAYCNPDYSGGNSTASIYGASIQVLANFSFTPDTVKNEARIEYFQFQVYSDQGPIVNMTYYIVHSKSDPLNGLQDVVTGISGNGAINFQGGLTYDGVPSNGGQGINDLYWDSNFTTGFVSDHIVGTSPDNVPQAVIDLRNAQTLYIDVRRQCTVTFNGNITVAMPDSNEVLQHIVLTKTGSEFAYGTYTVGTLPMPASIIEGPTSSPAPTPIAPSNITQP
jgi:hypothetical protein